MAAEKEEDVVRFSCISTGGQFMVRDGETTLEQAQIYRVKGKRQIIISAEIDEDEDAFVVMANGKYNQKDREWMQKKGVKFWEVNREDYLELAAPVVTVVSLEGFTKMYPDYADMKIESTPDFINIENNIMIVK